MHSITCQTKVMSKSIRLQAPGNLYPLPLPVLIVLSHNDLNFLSFVSTNYVVQVFNSPFIENVTENQMNEMKLL